MVHGTAFLATVKALPAVGRIHNCKVRIQAVVKCHIGLTDSRIINAHEALYRVLFQKSTEDCTTGRLTGLRYLVEDVWHVQNGIEKEDGVILVRKNGCERNYSTESGLPHRPTGTGIYTMYRKSRFSRLFPSGKKFFIIIFFPIEITYESIK